jgi:hemolysin-activating ACP:hemolysin acyltransferase
MLCSRLPIRHSEARLQPMWQVIGPRRPLIRSQSPLHQTKHACSTSCSTPRPAAGHDPVGLVNDEVEEWPVTNNPRMRLQKWKCGGKLWIVEVAAPFGTDELLKDLKAKVFKDRKIRYRAVEPCKTVVGVI